MKTNHYSKCDQKCFSFWRKVASTKIKSDYSMRQPNYNPTTPTYLWPLALICVACLCLCSGMVFGRGSWGVLFLLSPNWCCCVHLLQLVTATTATLLSLFSKGHHCTWFASGETGVERPESTVPRSHGWWEREGDGSWSPASRSSAWSTLPFTEKPANRYKGATSAG